MDVKGVHMHLGSQITNMSVFKEGTTKFVEFAKHLEEELGLEFELLNFWWRIRHIVRKNPV